MVSSLVQMIILKKSFSKKHFEGNTSTFCSVSNILQNCTSSEMSSNSLALMRTIMYMAALLRIGVTPLIVESRSKAAFEEADNFAFIESK